jgi:hypothetical protein
LIYVKRSQVQRTDFFHPQRDEGENHADQNLSNSRPGPDLHGRPLQKRDRTYEYAALPLMVAIVLALAIALFMRETYPKPRSL